MKKPFSMLLTCLALTSNPIWATDTQNLTATDLKSAALPIVIDAAPPSQPAINSEERDSFNSQEKAIAISHSMKIASKKAELHDEKTGITIIASYPQIQGDTLSVNAKQFNKIITESIRAQIADFKKNVALDNIHMQTLPPELRKNELHIDYDVDIIKPKNQLLISIRLTTEEMHAGRAHPYHNNRVVNFDLTTGKVIALNELFKKNTKFIQLLSAYTQNALNKKLKHDNWMVAKGTKPDASNFKNWNLQADSLLITFDEYQVAPYTYGAQEVEIPYADLKKIIAKSAPIADCANGTNCQIG